MSRLKDLERKWQEYGLTSDEAEEYESLWKAEDRKGGILAYTFVIGIAVILLAISLTSCTVTLHPDGSESYTADPDAFVRAIEVLGAK